MITKHSLHIERGIGFTQKCILFQIRKINNTWHFFDNFPTPTPLCDIFFITDFKPKLLLTAKWIRKKVSFGAKSWCQTKFFPSKSLKLNCKNYVWYIVESLEQWCPTLSPFATCGDSRLKCGNRDILTIGFLWKKDVIYKQIWSIFV